MVTLFVITLITTSVGTVSGLISGGYDGLFLGAGAGLVTGVAVWAATLMITQWRHERRLNRYFSQNGPVAQHIEQNPRW